MKKESAAEMRAMRKESHSQFNVLTQAVNSLTHQISTKFVEQDVNIQWMRGDFGVVSRGHGPSNQATKPATEEPSEVKTAMQQTPSVHPPYLLATVVLHTYPFVILFFTST